MISVAIVEDHDFYRQTLVAALQENSSFLIKGIYSSAEEALVYMPSNFPDVAIIDIKLKTKSGIEFVQQSKPYLAFTQFLMCSSYQNDENVFNALKAGASGYIVKGSTSIEIQDAVMDLHNGGSPMSPYIARKVIGLLQNKNDKTPSMGLSNREMQVLSLLSQGLLYKEISAILDISPNTVKNHCKNIYKRLHVQNKVEALNKFNGYNLQNYAIGY